VRIEKESDIFELMNTDLRKNEKHCILNWGSNTLFTQDFDGIVVKIETKWKEVIKFEDGSVIIEVSAWENRSDFVQWCCENNYCGIENLIDIPWNVGTAPVSNIWAYGAEVSSVVYEVEWIDLTTWESKIFKKSGCEFGYRTSIFKYSLRNQFLVTKVRFLLSIFNENYETNIWYKDIQNYISEHWISPKTPKDVSEIISEIRANKLPDWHKIWTAWSFFSNPIISLDERAELEKKFPDLSHHECIDFGERKVKLSAGQLIDQCGLKWWRIPNWTAWTYEKHALILVNEWWNADDVLEAMHYIQKSVKNKFWVQLEPEVVLI
jgi:UDP-N-acetylmuramate dehydrogenase